MHSLSVQVLSSEGLGTPRFFLQYSEGGFPFHLTVHPRPIRSCSLPRPPSPKIPAHF